LASTLNPFLWSTTAASNDIADSGINWSEGQSPGSVNASATHGEAGERSVAAAARQLGRRGQHFGPRGQDDEEAGRLMLRWCAANAAQQPRTGKWGAVPAGFANE